MNKSTESLAHSQPVPFTSVTLDGGLWGRLMETNRRATLPIEYKKCKETGRIDAFRLDWKPGQPNPPHIFWDSDVSKWIEAAAYSLATHPDPELEKQVDDAVDLIAGAQQPDGYLNTHFTVVEPEKRWTNLRDCHELYCAGNLLEGAVAYHAATGKRKFLDVACRYADYIDATFGPREGQKRGYCGHEEIELALVKLHHATGVRRYLDLAAFFIDERGRLPHYFDLESKARGETPTAFWASTYEYNQSHLPVREQTDVVGHSVRAMYLYSGMTDVAMATGDPTLLAACRRLWKNVTRKRMHITAGIGPVQSNEGFTTDYDLPNEGAYLETCATVGLVFWAHRLLNAERDGDVADVMECALYNGTISGVSHDGLTFFYGNPLASYPGFDGNGRYAGKGYHYRRSEWFDCACCPPNIARMIAQFPGYMYATGAKEASVHLYAQGTARVNVAGQAVRIDQKTDYPWTETVTLALTPERAAKWTLAVRIPGWCRKARLAVNGKSVKLAGITRKGYARITRVWQKNDQVELVLPMPPERIEAHPLARQDCGRVALQRGPVIYCLEQVDNGPVLNDVTLPRKAKLTVQTDRKLFGGIPVLVGTGSRRNLASWKDTLYRPATPDSKPVTLKAIPYFLWANRAPGEMLVWIREV
jgi:DUF1680 family protein